MSDLINITQYEELTGFARAAMEAADAQRRAENSLTLDLPNEQVGKITLRIDELATKQVVMAENRAYDAEPARSPGYQTKTTILENTPLSFAENISERDWLIANTTDDAATQEKVFNVIHRLVRSVEDALEYQRGQTLTTAKYKQVTQNGIVEEDWGRDASMDVTASALWSDPSTDILGTLTQWVQAYEDLNGITPGELIISREIANAIARNEGFAVQTINNHWQSASFSDIQARFADHGLPNLRVYRRTVRDRNRQDRKSVV